MHRGDYEDTRDKELREPNTWGRSRRGKMQWREIIINQTHVFEGILYDSPIHCYSYAEINLKSKSKTNVPFLFHSYTFLSPCKCSHLFLPECWFSPWEILSLKLFLVYSSGHCRLWTEVLQSVLISPRVKYHCLQNCRGLRTDALGLLFSVPITHHALPFLASGTSRYFLENVFWSFLHGSVLCAPYECSTCVYLANFYSF